MANVKNFGLIGVGENVQFGKAGPTLSKQGPSVLRADGSAAFMLPLGDNSARPTASTGMIRTNNQSTPVIEYYNGTTWVSLATGGAAVTSVNGTLNRVTSSNTGAGSTTLDIAATYVGQASITTLGTVTTGTWNGGVVGPTYGGTGVNNGSNTLTLGGSLTTSGAFASTFTMTGATNVTFPTSGTLLSTATIAANAVTSFQTSLSGLTPSTATNGAVTLAGTLGPTSGGTGVSSFAAGDVLYASATNVWSAGAKGSVSGVQAWDTDLDALAGLATTGIIVRTGAGTATTRTITGVAGRISVTDGSGVGGDPTIDLATVTNSGTGTFQKLTTDGYGRVTGTTAVVEADITAFTDPLYVNVSGDSMASAANLTFVGGGEVLGLPSTPSGNTAATSKAYVDSLVAGLSWKQAAHVMSTTNVSIAAPGATIDGQTMVVGERVLLVAETDPYDNGIYVFNGAATPMTRALDANTFQELNGAAIFIQTGSQADTGWTQTAQLTSLTTGATQVWSQFSGANAYIAGAGLDLTGNTFSVNVGAGITILPTDEVGIDVVSGRAVQLTGGVSASQLTFVLDGAGITSGLTQSGSGLKIAATGVTNAMLVNSGFAGTADSGSQTITLGDTLHIVGVSTQGTSVALTNPSGVIKQYAVTVADASSSQKGVASFATADFTVTAGNVVLNDINLTTGVTGVLPVANGGTNVSSLVAEQVLFGGAGGTAVAQDADFAFAPATNTLTLGTSTFAAPAAGDLTITATATNGDINLVPNGTGAVIIGPAGAGLIQSDPAQPLTVRGNTFLSLESVTGDTTMILPASNLYKVTVSGPTPAQYANGLAAGDLVNKEYVDTVAGSAAGDVKAFKQVVSLGANATTSIGTVLPTGATILSVKVSVTTLNTTSTLEVGISGTPDAYMSATENDPQTVGLYLAECMVVNSAVQIIATVAAQTGGVGSATVVVTYQIAN